jgi:hypothetical protein
MVQNNEYVEYAPEKHITAKESRILKSEATYDQIAKNIKPYTLYKKCDCYEELIRPESYYCLHSCRKTCYRYFSTCPICGTEFMLKYSHQLDRSSSGIFCCSNKCRTLWMSKAKVYYRLLEEEQLKQEVLKKKQEQDYKSIRTLYQLGESLPQIVSDLDLPPAMVYKAIYGASGKPIDRFPDAIGGNLGQ